MDNLPERYRVQVAQKLSQDTRSKIANSNPRNAVEGRSCSFGGIVSGKHSSVKPKKRICAPIRMKKKANEPNKTEAQFNRDILLGGGKYEAVTLHLPGGSDYTADWLFEYEGDVFLIEIKGSYHLPTHGRSVLAFKTACAQYPMFTFLFAELEKDGKTWNVGVYKDGKEKNTVRGTAKELHELQ